MTVHLRGALQFQPATLGSRFGLDAVQQEGQQRCALNQARAGPRVEGVGVECVDLGRKRSQIRAREPYSSRELLGARCRLYQRSDSESSLIFQHFFEIYSPTCNCRVRF